VGIKLTTFGGRYTRTLLPEGEPLSIRRVRCQDCLCTHAVLPAFLPDQVRYGAQTLAPYLENTQAVPPIAVWQQNLSDGPEDASTLYRWLRRFRANLKRILPLLQQALLELAPDAEIENYQTAVLETVSEPLATVALCQLSFWLAGQLLTVSGHLLQCSPRLSPVAFLNYFCWQKIGATLLSPPVNGPP